MIHISVHSGRVSARVRHAFRDRPARDGDVSRLARVRSSDAERRRAGGTREHPGRRTSAARGRGGGGRVRRDGDRASFYAPLVIARRAGCRRAFGCAHIAALGGDVLSRSAGWSAKRRFIYILADVAARCAERHVGRHHDPPIPHDSAWLRPATFGGARRTTWRRPRRTTWPGSR